MKTINVLAALVLLVSAAIGTYILLTDSYLWSAAPTHAEGLIVFVVLDLGLIGGLWWKPKLAIIGLTLLGLVQFGAMGADLFIGSSVGTSSVGLQSSFQKYLLGDTAFKALLGVQVVLVLIGIGAIIVARRSPPAPSVKPEVPATRPNV